ncbi:MAG TPA: hypothetical protein VFB54_17675 [Burkholderiales bacterium]|nr:hypothetical protein [Burkholderiales bacterium]
MKQLRAALPVVARDALGLIGAALISYGAWMVYRPAGFIVAGSLLLAGCLLLARAE